MTDIDTDADLPSIEFMVTRVLIELAGLFTPAGVMYIATAFYPMELALSDNDGRNRELLCALPSFVYLCSRLYLGLVFIVTYFMPGRHEGPIGKPLPSAAWPLPRNPLVGPFVAHCSPPYAPSSTGKFFNYALGSAVVVFPPFVFPRVQNTLLKMYEDYVGAIGDRIYEASLPEIASNWLFFKKILALFGAWFVLLFVLELLLRGVLWVLGALIRLVTGKGKETAGVAVSVEDCKKDN